MTKRTKWMILVASSPAFWYGIYWTCVISAAIGGVINGAVDVIVS